MGARACCTLHNNDAGATRRATCRSWGEPELLPGLIHLLRPLLRPLHLLERPRQHLGQQVRAELRALGALLVQVRADVRRYLRRDLQRELHRLRVGRRPGLGICGRLGRGGRRGLLLLAGFLLRELLLGQRLGLAERRLGGGRVEQRRQGRAARSQVFQAVAARHGLQRRDRRDRDARAHE